MSTPSNEIRPGYGGSAPQNGIGTAALIMGIVQFFCLPFIASILAIVFGKMGMNKAEQGLATNGGAAKAGFILGIIGLVLYLLGVFLWFILMVAAGASNSMS